MKLKQISIPIENSHDRLYKITKALTKMGITPTALTLVDKGDYGELRLLVSDLIAARQILMQKGIPGRIDEVVALEIEKKPEYLAQITKVLMDAGITIQYSYACVGSHPEKTNMVFRFSDNNKAIEVLAAINIRAAA